jgi:hypothetical protein
MTWSSTATPREKPSSRQFVRDKSRIPLVPEVTGGEFVPNILTRSTSAFIDHEMSSGDTVKFQGCVVAEGALFR